MRKRSFCAFLNSVKNGGCYAVFCFYFRLIASVFGVCRINKHQIQHQKSGLLFVKIQIESFGGGVGALQLVGVGVHCRARLAMPPPTGYRANVYALLDEQLWRLYASRTSRIPSRFKSLLRRFTGVLGDMGFPS